MYLVRKYSNLKRVYVQPSSTDVVTAAAKHGAEKELQKLNIKIVCLLFLIDLFKIRQRTR